MSYYLLALGNRPTATNLLTAQPGTYWILFNSVSDYGVTNYNRDIWVQFTNADLASPPQVQGNNVQFRFTNYQYKPYPPGASLSAPPGNVLIALPANTTYFPDTSNLYTMLIPINNVIGVSPGTTTQSMNIPPTNIVFHHVFY